jgi:hypothetical protein
MKKHLLTLSCCLAASLIFAQSPRMTLYEEFTGENCPPCASTNPGLNAKLLSATNATRVIAIKWQVPIPTAPSNAWSLYQTNKTEIDWRYRSTASGGYGYPSQSSASGAITSGVNSAPSGRFDGRHQWEFGATGDHPTYVSDAVILNAKNTPAPFTIEMMTAWNTPSTALTLTVNIQASQAFTATGPLVFRTVMVERLITFSVAPGTNGEKVFEDVAIKSFPTLQAGTPLTGNWTNAQSFSFTMTCNLPSYVRKKSEVSLVGFIQDDGTRMIHQAARAKPLVDARAVEAVVDPVCSSALVPVITVKNDGALPLTSLTISPFVDGVQGTDVPWTGNIAPDASETIAVTGVQISSGASGKATFSFNVIAEGEHQPLNNSSKVDFFISSSTPGNDVTESFAASTVPPAGWALINPNGGTAWFHVAGIGAYQQGTPNSFRYNFYGNSVVGDKDELYLPTTNLSGADLPVLKFDYSYTQRTTSSNDKLEIFVSKDCGANWTSIFSKSGAQLSTTGAPKSIPFTPEAFEWIPENITLPVGFNTSGVLTKIVTTNDFGNNLYLDEVNLFQPNPTGVSELTAANVMQANLYPNPSNGLSTLELSSPTQGTAKISVFNTLGQLQSTSAVQVQAGVNNISLDLRNNPSGVYILRVENGKATATSKVTLTH